MKHTFKSTEIAHKWAHDGITDDCWGKSPGNLSYGYGTIYSYGTAIGWKGYHAKNGIQETFFIINRTRYSVTTSKSQGRVGFATHDESVFNVTGIPRGAYIMPTAKWLFRYYLDQATQCEVDSKKPRIRQSTIDKLLAGKARNLAEAERVNVFFGLRRKVDAKVTEREAARIARANRKAEKEAKERQAQYDKQNEKVALEWIDGKGDHFPHGIQRVYLRKRVALLEESRESDAPYIESVTVETSKGAVIPYADGKRAFEFALKCRAKGWHKNGDTFPVGNYQLDAVNEQGVIAGCHRISWEELERFGKLEGWI